MGNQRSDSFADLRPFGFFLGKQPCRGRRRGALLFPRKKANVLQSRDQSSSSWLPRTVLRAAMGKNLTSISGTSGPPHPLQSTIQPILGVLEQFWPKNLAEQANPTASQVGRCGCRTVGRDMCVGGAGRGIFGRRGHGEDGGAKLNYAISMEELQYTQHRYWRREAKLAGSPFFGWIARKARQLIFRLGKKPVIH